MAWPESKKKWNKLSLDSAKFCCYNKNKETKKIVDEAYNRAKQILTDHIDKLHAVAAVLLEKEKIEADEFEKIFAE